MSDHYAKLWASILDSSVWREPPAHRLVWIAMLLMKDRNGFVGASVDGLARRANVTEEETRAALDSFLSPDPRSRNQDHEGRRIKVVPRGWHILNHEYFTQLQDKEAMRAYEAERKAEQRRRARESQNVPDTSGQDGDKRDSTRLSVHLQTTDTSSDDGGEHERNHLPRHEKVEHSPDFVTFWNTYDRKVSKPHAAKAWLKIAPDAALAAEIIKAAAAYVKATPDPEFRKHPATWLNARGWEDEAPQSKPAPGSKLGQPLVEHPRGMPIPFDSPLSPCHCGMCVTARKRKEQTA